MNEPFDLPTQFKKEHLGFVKLHKNSKKPIENGWQKNPHQFNQVPAWMTDGFNYGVICGSGNLVVLDCDQEAFYEQIKDKLPKTFIVKTPKRGKHVYLYCQGLLEIINLDKDGIHYGEIRGAKAQVVGPGSTHPDTGTKYVVECNEPIAQVNKEELLGLLIDYLPLKRIYKHEKVKDGNSVNVEEVVSKFGFEGKHIGDQIAGSHPVHGSTNGTNFVIHPAKNVWHCFRHGTGGGVLSLIGVLEGIIDCESATVGGLKGDDFKKTLERAIEKYDYKDESMNPSKEEKLFTDKELASIDQRIKNLSSNTPRTQLPKTLEPFIKELALIKETQSHAILTGVIKDHFGLKADEIRNYLKEIKNHRKAIVVDAMKKKQYSDEEKMQMLQEDENTQKMHPAQDYCNRVMNFAVRIKEELFIVTSERKLISFSEAAEKGIKLKCDYVDMTKFSNEAVAKYINGQAVNLSDACFLDEGSISYVYGTLRFYIRRFIYFSDDAYLDYIVLWIIGTYFFTIFRYYPYVWLNAEKGSGKTLLMEVIFPVSFNGELISNPTEAVIYRDITNNLITMFIDEVEQLGKHDKDLRGSLISILNTGFNKSSRVKRVDKNMHGELVVKAFSAYSPKMFAGINQIDDVLQDRTVKIPLLRKKEGEHVERYKESEEILRSQKEIRDALYIVALNYCNKIADVYQADKVFDMEGVEHVTNREKDIWEPIFIIAQIIDGEMRNHDLINSMKTLSHKAVLDKQDDNLTENDTQKLLKTFKAMTETLEPIGQNDDLWYFEADAVLKYFNETNEFGHFERSNGLTSKLKKINVKSTQIRVNDSDVERPRVYEVSVAALNDLCERFNAYEVKV